MKNFTLTIAIVLSQMLAIAQCPQGEMIIFSSQAQIDEFQTNYPNCMEIEGGVTITGGNIVNLYGLNNLTSIGGDLNFLYTVVLSNMLGLEGLTSIGGTLAIIENYTMTSLTGLNNVTTIGDDLYINKNNFLTSLNGLDNLTSIGEGISISYSLALSNVGGLNNLISVGSDFEFIHNPSLTNFSGLENLTSIGGYCLIQYNDTLTSIDGLETLTSIGGELSIRSNPILSSLSGLDNIDAASISDLFIYSNFSLSTCEVLSICNYLVNPNGTITISNNATGCSSQEEVEEACEWVSINELNTLQKIGIYPIPTQSSITIELPTTPSNNTYITLSNTNGQEVLSRLITNPKTEIDISHLPASIYIVKVWDDKNVMVQKVIKQ